MIMTARPYSARAMRRICPTLAQAAVLCTVAAGGVVLDLASHELALTLLPVILLVAWLAVGRFPGEELIERLRAPRRSSRVVARPVNARPTRPPSFQRRVGLAVAFALAVRPPPVAIVLS
jgi:hypothetical protein